MNYFLWRDKKRVLLLLMVLMVCSISIAVTMVKKASAAMPNDWATSYYVSANNYQNLYSLGYTLGNNNANTSGTQKPAVILLFGIQKTDTSGNWGASLFGTFKRMPK
ncbi:hypothetical protein ACFSR7_21525 [Cohnella sp. GCM10020058]|uniref:hypothetical protein n=1 Tax=Cohnella sp. GCM10020058 TaxID=3317330 RepID=UPI0036452A81